MPEPVSLDAKTLGSMRADVPSAFHVMAEAERHFGGPEVTWQDRIVLYRVQKNNGGVQAT